MVPWRKAKKCKLAFITKGSLFKWFVCFFPSKLAWMEWLEMKHWWWHWWWWHWWWFSLLTWGLFLRWEEHMIVRFLRFLALPCVAFAMFPFHFPLQPILPASQLGKKTKLKPSLSVPLPVFKITILVQRWAVLGWSKCCRCKGRCKMKGPQKKYRAANEKIGSTG